MPRYEVFLEFRRHDTREEAWPRLVGREGTGGLESANRLDFEEGYLFLEAADVHDARQRASELLGVLGLAEDANVTLIYPAPTTPEA